MALKSSISAIREGFYEVSLEGRVDRPHWVVQLFHALSMRQVSVVSGNATQVKLGEWKSKFVLDFSKSSADPMRLDYSAFSEQNEILSRPVAPKLSRFKLERRSDQNLDLRLEGPDQIGFLASILGKVSAMALFPTSLDIRTVGGQIKDYLVLAGIAGRPPTESAYQALGNILRSFVV